MSFAHLTATQCASFGLGAVIGLIAATIFAVILRRIENKQPQDAIDGLYKLIYLVCGAGLADYVAFDFILNAGAIVFYLGGLSIVFLPCAGVVFVSWMRS